jgi:Fe-Mn family superoxide dismutase
MKFNDSLKLAELINKYFSDFEGFKETFKKAIVSRVLPGWVWLGLTADKQLIITQTNNEDNTLMQGMNSKDHMGFRHYLSIMHSDHRS